MFSGLLGSIHEYLDSRLNTKYILVQYMYQNMPVFHIVGCYMWFAGLLGSIDGCLDSRLTTLYILVQYMYQNICFPYRGLLHVVLRSTGVN